MAKFDLLTSVWHSEPYWFRDHGGHYMDCDGNAWVKDALIPFKVIETVDADSFEELDHTKTGLFKPDSNRGWLSPTGQFYGCEYHYHDLLARWVLGKETHELDHAGWIRVAGPRALLSCERHPTDAQRQWAVDHGHRIEGDD